MVRRPWLRVSSATWGSVLAISIARAALISNPSGVSGSAPGSVGAGSVDPGVWALVWAPAAPAEGEQDDRDGERDRDRDGLTDAT